MSFGARLGFLKVLRRDVSTVAYPYVNGLPKASLASLESNDLNVLYESMETLLNNKALGDEELSEELNNPKYSPLKTFSELLKQKTPELAVLLNSGKKLKKECSQ